MEGLVRDTIKLIEKMKETLLKILARILPWRGQGQPPTDVTVVNLYGFSWFPYKIREEFYFGEKEFWDKYTIVKV